MEMVATGFPTNPMQQFAQNMRNKAAWERQQMRMRNMQHNPMQQAYDNQINDIIRNYQMQQMAQQNPMMPQQPLPQQNIIQSPPVQQPVDQSSPSSPVTQEQLQIVKEQIMMEAEQKFGSH
jgi:hypothetical protein